MSITPQATKNAKTGHKEIKARETVKSLQATAVDKVGVVKQETQEEGLRTNQVQVLINQLILGTDNI